jgi:hypothetical protein
VEAAQKLTIRIPSDGGIYVIDPGLATQQQMLPLEAIGPPGASVSWTVDGRPVESAGTSFLWKLEPGKHIANASSGALSGSAHFDVQGLKH